ncbi:MAG: capsular polysaccharide biosynthesis protein [Lentimonas sp.]
MKTNTELTPHGCCLSDPILPAINTIRSDRIRETVTQRLVADSNLSTRTEHLEQHLQVTHIDDSLKIQIHYPDPEIAAQIANTFAEAYIDDNRRLEMDGSMKARGPAHAS